jgi:hypothetical protein
MRLADIYFMMKGGESLKCDVSDEYDVLFCFRCQLVEIEVLMKRDVTKLFDM